MLKFSGSLILVNDISVSRKFYEELLEQKVDMDFGPNVSFEGNLAIHLKTHFQGLLGDAERYPVTTRANNGELYFETDEIDRIFQRLEQAGVEFLHVIQEQPWAQRVMRFYDPDGHIIEIGETMEIVVWRLYQQGCSVAQVVERTGMPREFIEFVLRKHAEPGKKGK